MKTRIVNIRNESCDIKITRKPDDKIPDPPVFGCFGNPFHVEEYGREECIRLYKEYFYDRIANDKAFKDAVESLKGKRLGCFCKPLACHGDIIKEYLDH